MSDLQTERIPSVENKGFKAKVRKICFNNRQRPLSREGKGEEEGRRIKGIREQLSAVNGNPAVECNPKPDGSQTQTTKNNIETINEIDYERIDFPRGRFVNKFLAEHPEVLPTEDLWPQILATNLGRSEVTILLPGYKEKHTESIMKGKTVQNLVGELNNTVAFVDWMNTTHIEELVIRGIADWIEQGKFKGIKLFGASHGGYFALRIAKYFKELSKEGFRTPLESIIVAVAPTSRENLKAALFADQDLIIGGIHLGIGELFKKALGKSLPIPGLLRRQRSDAVRIANVSRLGFKKGDFPDGLTIHYFSTDPRTGDIDKLVNQPASIENLKKSGAHLVVHEFHAGEMGHVISKDDTERMNKTMLDILKS